MTVMGKNTDRAVVSEDFKIGVDALVRDFRYDESKRGINMDSQ